MRSPRAGGRRRRRRRGQGAEPFHLVGESVTAAIIVGIALVVGFFLLPLLLLLPRVSSSLPLPSCKNARPGATAAAAIAASDVALLQFLLLRLDGRCW